MLRADSQLVTSQVYSLNPKRTGTSSPCNVLGTTSLLEYRPIIVPGGGAQGNDFVTPLSCLRFQGLELQLGSGIHFGHLAVLIQPPDVEGLQLVEGPALL